MSIKFYIYERRLGDPRIAILPDGEKHPRNLPRDRASIKTGALESMFTRNRKCNGRSA